MHIALSFSKSNALTANDVSESMRQIRESDNRNIIFVRAVTKGEAGKLFNGLSEGGKVEMPIACGRAVIILECLQTSLVFSR